MNPHVSDEQKYKRYAVHATLDITVFVEAETKEDTLKWAVTSVRTKDDDNSVCGVLDVEIGRLDVEEIEPD